MTEIKECWNYLDCYSLTGFPPAKCPNYEACKDSAYMSNCGAEHLPYRIAVIEGIYQRLLCRDEKGKNPTELAYINGKVRVLVVGYDSDGYRTKISSASGFARAELLPYIYLPTLNELHATPHNDEQIAAGWIKAEYLKNVW